MSGGPINRTSLELFRDCMRLVRHLAPGYSPKAQALRQTVRSQFEANRALTDPVQVENAKASAVRALSNYMLYQSAQKDGQMQQAMKDQITRVKKEKREEDQKNRK
eukprot:CAMPEP_0176008810 /NCGR_PEP_ID=MMETSP0120_2-20121206/3932_1 /TAXON_ID=160619 /ORGANISM="Kryptoperidinium foliaceum, Strain CCMP 1326" /LENGTH=105 /DNA_ID=CAMNT_0017341597 /DNA_START=107 /DNA_END=424 /DNA_ORIENTATION=+